MSSAAQILKSLDQQVESAERVIARKRELLEHGMQYSSELAAKIRRTIDIDIVAAQAKALSSIAALFDSVHACKRVEDQTRTIQGVEHNAYRTQVMAEIEDAKRQKAKNEAIAQRIDKFESFYLQSRCKFEQLIELYDNFEQKFTIEAQL